MIVKLGNLCSFGLIFQRSFPSEMASHASPEKTMPCPLYCMIPRHAVYTVLTTIKYKSQVTIERRMEQVVCCLKLLDTFMWQQRTIFQRNRFSDGNCIDENSSSHPHGARNKMEGDTQVITITCMYLHSLAIKFACQVTVHAHHLGFVLLVQLSAP